MIKLSNNLWQGSAIDEKLAKLEALEITAILNVAYDLQSTRGWDQGITYMQVGLIDGPGNTISAYYAAVLALDALLQKHNVLICCHAGSRSMAVTMMWMHLFTLSGFEWDECLNILSEKADQELPEIHEAHIRAFDTMDWELLKKSLEPR